MSYEVGSASTASPKLMASAQNPPYSGTYWSGAWSNSALCSGVAKCHVAPLCCAVMASEPFCGFDWVKYETGS